jgi:transcriptional regulator with XRE-family HTH domain
VTEVARRLRIAREQAGLSQGQVAKLLKMHRPTISEIEAGRRKVSAQELTTFAETYGVSVAWLTATKDDDEIDARVMLAARELSALKSDDLDRVMRFLATLRAEGDKR